MKRIITTLVMLGFLSSQTPLAQAQNIDSKKLRFGAFIAPTLSWMRPTANKSDDNQFLTSNNGSKIGFTYGLMAEYRFAENYSFVTGLQINMTGGKINTERDRGAIPTDPNAYVTTTAFDYNLQYLEVPLALKMRTNLIEGFRFFGQLGITPSVNIGKKVSFEVNTVEDGLPQRYEDSNVKLKGALTISPILFQMNIGVGAEYPLNDQLSAYFGLFFNNGFAPDVTNTVKYNNFGYRGTFKDGNVRLNNFALRLGLFF